MAIGGLPTGVPMMVGPQKLPEHTTWVGALWGGTSQAAQSAWTWGKLAVTGHMKSLGLDGTVHSVAVSRDLGLDNLPSAISNAYKVHTLSLRDPQKFQQWNAAVDNFRHGTTTR